MAELLPGAEPFYRTGGAVGVLLCHGFTGSPQSLRPWAEFLADDGLAVAVPLLPGHGTTWQDMARTTAADWNAAVRPGRAARAVPEVFVMGLSLGGCLALGSPNAAAGHQRLVLVNPSLAPTAGCSCWPGAQVRPAVLPGVGSDIRSREWRSFPTPGPFVRRVAAADVAADHPRSGRRTQPVLTTGAARTSGRAASMRALEAGLTPGLPTVRTCSDSYHVATMDNDAQAISTESLQFVRDHCRDKTRSAGGTVPETT